MNSMNATPVVMDEERTPTWMKAVRVLQALFSIIVFALSAYLSTGGYMPIFGLGIVTAIFALCILGYYAIFRKTAVRRFYKPTVRLVLEAFMVIMYLALFAATASKRASIVRTCDYDDDDDDDDNGNRYRNACRAFVNNHRFYRDGGLSIMAALAGVGALTWITYVISFLWAMLRFVRDRDNKKNAAAVTSEPKHMSMSMHDVERGAAAPHGGVSPMMMHAARSDMGHAGSPDYQVSSMSPSPQASTASPIQQEHTMRNVAVQEEQGSESDIYQPYRPQAQAHAQPEYADGLIATGGVRDHLNVGGPSTTGSTPTYNSAAVQPPVGGLASHEPAMGAAAVPSSLPPADVVELDSSQRPQNHHPQGVELP